MSSINSFEDVFKLTNTLMPLITFGISNIPIIGGILSTVFGMFWSELNSALQPSIWDQIKEFVSKMIDQKLVDFEINQKQASLAGIRDNIKRYQSVDNKEKGILLGAMIVNCDLIKQSFFLSTNKQHLLPYAVPFAYLHVGLMAERARHGKALYDYDGSNTWKEDLKSTTEQYEKFLKESYDAWVKWRYSTLRVIRNDNNGWGTTWQFKDDLDSSNNINFDYSEEVVRTRQLKIFNADDTNMFTLYRYSFLLGSLYYKYTINDVTVLNDQSLLQDRRNLIYVYRPNDVLYYLSIQFRIDFEPLIHNNGLYRPIPINKFPKAGDIIKIPVFHILKSGENADTVAKYYNVNVDILRAVNKNVAWNVGAEIKIPPITSDKLPTGAQFVF